VWDVGKSLQKQIPVSIFLRSSDRHEEVSVDYSFKTCDFNFRFPSTLLYERQGCTREFTIGRSSSSKEYF
jgi:hypothetical protein